MGYDVRLKGLNNMAYPEKLKISLVRQYERGDAVADIANAANESSNTVYRWDHL